MPRPVLENKPYPSHVGVSRAHTSVYQFIRTWKLMSQIAVHGPMNVIATKLLGLKDRFGNDLGDMDGGGCKDVKFGSRGEDGAKTRFEDNWSFDWWKLFMKLGPLHPKASWGVTRGQVTKTAPLVKNVRQVGFMDITHADGQGLRKCGTWP